MDRHRDNGVSVKETMRLSANHRFKITSIYGQGVEKKYRGKRESASGTWRLGPVDIPDQNGTTSKGDALFLKFDKYPKQEMRLLFYRQVPALTDILTTTFAGIGDEARVFKLLNKENYRPPWKIKGQGGR